MLGPLRVSSIDSSVNGEALLDRSVVIDNMLASGVEPPIVGNSLGLGGCDSYKDSSLLAIGTGNRLRRQ
ncbi:hypothetical protein SLA2020_286030 [Shorea laevis]